MPNSQKTHITRILIALILITNSKSQIVEEEHSYFKSNILTSYTYKDISIAESNPEYKTSILKITQTKQDTFNINLLIFLKNRFWSNGFSFRFTLKNGDQGELKAPSFANYFKGSDLILESKDDDSIKIQNTLTLAQEFNGSADSLKGIKINAVSENLKISIFIDPEKNISGLQVKKKYFWYIILAISVHLLSTIIIRILTKDQNKLPVYGLLLSNFYILACFHCYIRAVLVHDRANGVLLYLIPYLGFLNLFLFYSRKNNSKQNKEDYKEIRENNKKKSVFNRIQKPWLFWYSLVGILTMLIFDWIWPIAFNVTVVAVANYGVALENMLYVRNNTTALLTYFGYFLYPLLLLSMCYLDNNVNLDVGDTGRMEKMVFFLSSGKFVLTLSVVWCKYGWTGQKAKSGNSQRERNDLGSVDMLTNG